jgi:hypothetical protein
MNLHKTDRSNPEESLMITLFGGYAGIDKCESLTGIVICEDKKSFLSSLP